MLQLERSLYLYLQCEAVPVNHPRRATRDVRDYKAVRACSAI